MKKSLSILLAFLMVIFAFPFSAITSFAETSGDFEYEVISEEDKTCAIIGYTGTAADLEIPQDLDEYSVTTIGDYAFEDCTSLLSVTVPAGITVIIHDKADTHIKQTINLFPAQNSLIFF